MLLLDPIIKYFCLVIFITSKTKGEKKMKLNDLKTMRRNVEMPMGRNEVVFNRIDYRTDRETGDITGIFVHIQDYKPLFIPFFDNGENFQLDLLLDQLGCNSYDPDEINQHTGEVIVAHRYLRETENQTFRNVSFNANYGQDTEEVLA